MTTIERNKIIRATLEDAESRGITVSIETDGDASPYVGRVVSVNTPNVLLDVGTHRAFTQIEVSQIDRIDEVITSKKLLLGVESQCKGAL